LAVALETKADGQFISDQLKIGRLLQRNKILEELPGCRRPIWPMVAGGELGSELGAVFKPTGPQSIQMRAANLEQAGSLGGVDLFFTKALENLLEKGIGNAFS